MPAVPPLVLARLVLTWDAGSLLPYARAALDSGDLEGGLWIARRAAALAPGESWPYVVEALLSSGPAALGNEFRAHRIDPANAETLQRIARCRSERSDFAGVAAAQRRLVALDPADAQASYVLAVARLGNGDSRGAADLARAVRLAPCRANDAYEVGRGSAISGHVGAAAAAFAALAREAPVPAALDRPTAWPLDLVAAVKAGASLASVMIPDPRQPANNPEYLETYSFDQVILSERCFWALPQPLIFDPAGPAFGGFAYCGDTRLFLRYNTEAGHRTGSPVGLMLYPGDAYKHFEFVVRPDHRLVYDSAEPDQVTALEAAIRSGATMRVVVETGDGLVHALPVNLCFLYRESGAVRVTTELRHAPELCLTPVEALWPYVSGLLNDFDNRPSFLEMLLPGRSRLLARRLVIHSEGWYDTCEADGTVGRHAHAGFRVYART